MNYGISSRDYLYRAEECLKEGSHRALFYAAFEIRCGIESRMQEYLDVWNHISKKKKSGWRIAELGRNVEEAFRLSNSILRWAVHDRTTNSVIVVLYHTPVTKQLRTRGEKLGNYLHSLKQYKEANDKWWMSFRTELNHAVSELRIANLGTLLGPPLMKKGTGQVDSHIEMPPGSNADDLMNKILGKDLTIEVKYLKRFPSKPEPQAIIWPMQKQ